VTRTAFSLIIFSFILQDTMLLINQAGCLCEYGCVFPIVRFVQCEVE
jgi:hypothetical protein